MAKTKTKLKDRETRATCDMVHEMLTEEGYPGTYLMYSPDGYYYFSGGIADHFGEQGIYGGSGIGTYKMIWEAFNEKISDNWARIECARYDGCE